MDLAHLFIYGFIQAFCEFLPISSSAHLRLLPAVLSLNDPGAIFDLFLHLGTCLAIIFYFRKKLKGILFQLFSDPRNYSAELKGYIWTTFFSIFFISIFMPFKKYFDESNSLIALNLVFFGFLLFYFDRYYKQKENIKYNWRFFFLIGLSQAIAIFPGVSRSGATITMGRFLESDRKQISEFTFLLSLPIILLGSLYKGLKIYQGEETPHFLLGDAFIGIAVSFILGLLVIHYFLKLVSRISFEIFFFYRLFLGILIFSLSM
jgi:undecaprenyl-diphosphatase